MLYAINLNEKMLVQAVDEYNLWQGKACIRYDLRDGAVWTDVYCGDNDNDYYKSKAIVTIARKGNMLGRNGKTSVVKMRNFARSCHAHDWAQMTDYDTYNWMQEIEWAVCYG